MKIKKWFFALAREAIFLFNFMLNIVGNIIVPTPSVEKTHLK